MVGNVALRVLSRSARREAAEVGAVIGFDFHTDRVSGFA
jgi:hypothetical protein